MNCERQQNEKWFRIKISRQLLTPSLLITFEEARENFAFLVWHFFTNIYSRVSILIFHQKFCRGLQHKNTEAKESLVLLFCCEFYSVLKLHMALRFQYELKLWARGLWANGDGTQGSENGAAHGSANGAAHGAGSAAFPTQGAAKAGPPLNDCL